MVENGFAADITRFNPSRFYLPHRKFDFLERIFLSRCLLWGSLLP